MKYLMTVAVLLAMATLAQAQERTAAQNYDAQVNWASLRTQIDLVNTQNKILAGQLTKLVTCSGKGKIWAPNNPTRDTDDCVSPLSEIDTVVVSASMCVAVPYPIKDPPRAYTKTVTCPTGTVLLGCSGGPGDVDETNEGDFVRPNNANGCEIVVGQPRCSNNLYWTHSWVFAHCAKLK